MGTEVNARFWVKEEGTYKRHKVWVLYGGVTGQSLVGRIHWEPWAKEYVFSPVEGVVLRQGQLAQLDELCREAGK